MTPTFNDAPRLKAAWLALGWLLTAVVVVASLLPVTELPHVKLWDKAEHVVAYAGLAFVFAGTLGRARWRTVLWGLLTLGAGLEVAQALAGTGRHAEWWDLVADAVGVGLGLAVAAAIPGGWCRRVERAFDLTRSAR